MSQSANSPNAGLKTPRLLVLREDASLSIVDPLCRRPTAHVIEGIPSTVGSTLATSQDGRFAYLPLFGIENRGKRLQSGRFMLVLNVAEGRVVGRVDFGHSVRHHHVKYDHSSQMLYVTTELEQSVTIVDPTTLRIVGSIPTNADGSHMLALSSDGQRAYTANFASATISVLDIASRTCIETVPVSFRPERICIAIDNNMVFTTHHNDSQVSVIDTDLRSVRGFIKLPAPGFGVAASPCGMWLLVAMPSMGGLAIISLRSMKVVASIAIGTRMQEVLIRPDGRLAYVSSPETGSIAVVSLGTWKFKRWITVGTGAIGLAWAAPKSD